MTATILGPSGPYYYLSKEQIDAYHRDGFLHIPAVANANDMERVEEAFEDLVNGKANELGNDLTDITGEPGKTMMDNAGVSIMMPSMYHQNMNATLIKQRCAHITQQLLGDGMMLDFDRFIAKKPHREDAVFHWHQDHLYCLSHGNTVDTDDSRTAVFSIAIDETTEENGCIKYVIGSHREEKFRPHVPVDPNMKSMYLITKTSIDETQDKVATVPIHRGDLTVHGERVVHGSSGNRSKGWRRSYMVQFRAAENVEKRRQLGISRSLNHAGGVQAEMAMVEPNKA
jgi:phytanoyl-CoA hydroxylase